MARNSTSEMRKKLVLLIFNTRMRPGTLAGLCVSGCGSLVEEGLLTQGDNGPSPSWLTDASQVCWNLHIWGYCGCKQTLKEPKLYDTLQ